MTSKHFRRSSGRSLDGTALPTTGSGVALLLLNFRKTLEPADVVALVDGAPVSP